MSKFQGVAFGKNVEVLDEAGVFLYVDLEQVDELIEALREGRKAASAKRADVEDTKRVLKGALLGYRETLEECLKDETLKPKEVEAFQRDLGLLQELLAQSE